MESNIFNRRQVKLLWGLLMCLVLIGCGNRAFDTEVEMLSYLKDEKNGYIQHKKVNGVDFTLMYRPTDLLVKQELGDSISSDRVKALRGKYSKYLYFNLSMSKNNKELLSAAPKNRAEFGQMVNQLVFGMTEKVHLYTQSNDTVQMVDYVYPRLYGMGKSSNMMFIFQREEKKLKEEYLNFNIQDFDLQTGEVNFKVPSRKINKEPSIQFKN